LGTKKVELPRPKKIQRDTEPLARTKKKKKEARGTTLSEGKNRISKFCWWRRKRVRGTPVKIAGTVSGSEYWYSFKATKDGGRHHEVRLE